MDDQVTRALDDERRGPLTVDITAIGRRTGAPRCIENWIVKVGESVVIGGTPGPATVW